MATPRKIPAPKKPLTPAKHPKHEPKRLTPLKRSPAPKRK